MQITGRITILVLCLTFLPTKFSNAEEKFWSLKNDKVNVRYGHGKGHAIKYVYRKITLPVKQIDKKDNWRRIVDLKNNSGWIHDSQLKKSNSIIILIDKILFKKPSHLSKPIVRLQKGRLLIIKNCEDNWCKITDNNYSGWIKAENIWGSIK